MGRWVTSKGRRIYIPDEGEENPYAKKSEKKKERNILGEEVDFEEYARNMEKNKDDWAVEYDLSKVDMKQEEKERKARERADEEDYYDLTHNEGRYATTSKTKTINDRLKEDAEKFRKDPNVAAREGWGNGYYQEVKEYMNQQKDTVKETISKNENLKEKQIAKNKKQVDSLNGKTTSPKAQANNMTEKELRAYVKKNGLTKNYNMMLNNKTNYSQSNQMKVLRDLVSDDIAVREARKKKKK